MHRSKQHLYSIISPARAAGISRPRAIETANVKPHLTLRAKKAFISADIEMNPDPVLRIRGGDPCGGKQTNRAASCPWPLPRQTASIAFCADLRLATDQTRSQRSAVDNARYLRCGQSAPSYML